MRKGGIEKLTEKESYRKKRKGGKEKVTKRKIAAERGEKQPHPLPPHLPLLLPLHLLQPLPDPCRQLLPLCCVQLEVRLLGCAGPVLIQAAHREVPGPLFPGITHGILPPWTTASTTNHGPPIFTLRRQVLVLYVVMHQQLDHLAFHPPFILTVWAFCTSSLTCSLSYISSSIHSYYISTLYFITNLFPILYFILYPCLVFEHLVSLNCSLFCILSAIHS